MMRILPITFLLLLGVASAFGQDWQQEGNLPLRPIAADVNDQQVTVVTRANVYTSTDGGATFTQKLNTTNAPFLQEPGDAPDGRSIREFNGFTEAYTQVFGDVLFLAPRYELNSSNPGRYSIYTSSDGGTTLDEVFVERYANTTQAQYGNQFRPYRVDDDTFLATFRTSGPEGGTSIYISDDKAATWNEFAFNGSLGASYVGSNQQGLAFLVDEGIVFYDPADGAVATDTIELDGVRAARVSEDAIETLAFGRSQTSSGDLTYAVSTDGGETFTDQSQTLPKAPISSAQIVGDYIFASAGSLSSVTTTAYQIDLASFSTAVAVSGDGQNADDGPYRLTADGRLINARPSRRSVATSDAPGSPEPAPFRASDDGFAQSTELALPEYSLAALPQYGNSYLSFNRYSVGAFYTNDGKKFFKSFSMVNRPYDLRYFALGAQAVAYTDPTNVTYYATDATEIGSIIRAVNSRPVIAIEGRNGALYHNRLVNDDGDATRDTQNGLVRSVDGGVNFAPYNDGSFPVRNEMIGDPVSGDFFGILRRYGNAEGEPVTVDRSTDEGLSYTSVEDADVPRDANTSGYNPYPRQFAYNRYLFAYTDSTFNYSTDGGVTFAAADAPFSFYGAQVYRIGNKIGVRTRDERFFSIDPNAWLGSGGGTIEDGSQIDLEISLLVSPSEARKFEKFEVTVRVTNTGTVDATGVNFDLRVGRNADDYVNRGGVEPEGDLEQRGTIPAGESRSLTFFYFRLDGDPIRPWAQITYADQPDVDSRPNNRAVFDAPEEDDEAFWNPNDNTVCADDNIEPVLSDCPEDISVSTAGETASATWTAPSVSDNCSGDLSLSASANPGDPFPVGTTVVTYTASDAAGNQTTCSFLVQVFQEGDPACSPDATAPEITDCPADFALTTQGDSAAAAWTPPTASDNCGGDIELASNFTPGDNLPVGENAVTYTATDAAGNETTCTFTITVTQEDATGCYPDETAPAISDCPVDQTISTLDASAAAGWSEPTFADNCSGGGGLNIRLNYSSGFSFPIGVTRVVYLVNDAAGNLDSCEFNITVIQSDSVVVSTKSGGPKRQSSDKLQATLVPNPIGSGAQTALRLNVKEAGDYVLRVVDVLGRSVEQQPVYLQAGEQRVAVPSDGLPAGMYQVSIANPNSTTGGVPLSILR